MCTRSFWAKSLTHTSSQSADRETLVVVGGWISVCGGITLKPAGGLRRTQFQAQQPSFHRVRQLYRFVHAGGGGFIIGPPLTFKAITEESLMSLEYNQGECVKGWIIRWWQQIFGLVVTVEILSNRFRMASNMAFWIVSVYWSVSWSNIGPDSTIPTAVVQEIRVLRGWIVMTLVIPWVFL